MKKLLFVLLAFLCCFLFSNTSIAYAESGSAVFYVSANSAIIYHDADLASERLATLPHKTNVSVETEDGQAKEYANGPDVFYKVTYGETQGFMLSNFLLAENQTITSIPNFNGKTNAECFVFDLQGENFVQTTLELEKGQKIFLYEGYNRKSEYTAVAFVHNNEVMYGYIKTNCVDPNGINPIIITCICLIVAILGIAFSWMFVKKRKKKKMA